MGELGATVSAGIEGQRVRLIARLWDSTVTVLACIAGGLFGFGSLYITVDVLCRKFFGFHSGVTAEFSGYMLCIGASWGMAYAMRTDGHVRIDVLQTRFSPRWRFITDLLALAVMAMFATVLSIYSWKLAVDSFVIGARALSVLPVPLSIPQGVMSAGFTLMAIEACVAIVQRIAAGARASGERQAGRE